MSKKTNTILLSLGAAAVAAGAGVFCLLKKRKTSDWEDEFNEDFEDDFVDEDFDLDDDLGEVPERGYVSLTPNEDKKETPAQDETPVEEPKEETPVEEETVEETVEEGKEEVPAE